MRPPSLRVSLPWLIGLSLILCLVCTGLTVWLGLAAAAGERDRATRRMTAQASVFSERIEADLALFDLALREAAEKRDPGQEPPRLKLLELPLTARYVGFMNVLNEVGDVIADSRSNVSRPVNFAGRDYFMDQVKNPSDGMMIGRPFATAPNQHASIPISRRMTTPGGAFSGVVVLGVHLTWLSELLSRTLPGPAASVIVRRADGLMLVRSPPNEDAAGPGGVGDPAWREFMRTGAAPLSDGAGGIRLFQRVGASSLVLELSLDHAAIAADAHPWPILLTPLVIIPGLCALVLGIAGHRVLRRAARAEAAAAAATDESMRLLTNMSHELRTPLTGILGQAELMVEEGCLNRHQVTRLSWMIEAGTLMRAIVNRVIDVARPEHNDAPPVLTRCDLDALMRTCASMLESEARAKHLRLIVSVEPSAPRSAMLARDLVEQVLNNLLMNAVKYTARGTVSLCVTGDTANLRFEVMDTGAGIPRAKWRRLFHEYDRLDAKAAGVEGTGLGLSISERLVHRMRGRIGYRDNPLGGAVFWVELPTPASGPSNAAAQTEPDRTMPQDATAGSPRPDNTGGDDSGGDDTGANTPAADVADANAGTCGTPATDRGPPARMIAQPPKTGGLRLLLADDLDLTRSVTADYLRSGGHIVTEVADGGMAIEAARTRDFDAILTDMRMPVMNGREAARRIRTLPGRRGRTPIVLVTADLIALGENVSGNTAIDLCLMKPFTRSELLSVVAKAASLSKDPLADPADSKVLDNAVFKDLQQCLSEAKFAAHLQAAARRIEALLVLLQRADTREHAVTNEAVHDLTGVAGLLGLVTLSSCLRRFEIAGDRPGSAAALYEAAQEAARALAASPFARVGLVEQDGDRM